MRADAGDSCHPTAADRPAAPQYRHTGWAPAAARPGWRRANVALGSQITAVHIVQRVINARGARLRVHVAGGWRIAARQAVAADAALLLLAALTAGVQALHFASQQITLIGARHGAVVVFHRVDYSRRRLGHVAVFAAPNAGALCVWLRQRRAAIKAFFKRGAVPAPALGTFQGMILLDSKSETYRYSTPYVKIPARSRYHGQMRAGRAERRTFTAPPRYGIIGGQNGKEQAMVLERIILPRMSSGFPARSCRAGAGAARAHHR